MGDAQRHTWGAKYASRKAVNRLTGPAKTATNGPNMGILRKARPRHRPPKTCVWGGKVEPGGAGSPFVSSAQPLVNSAPQRRRSSVEGGSTYVVVGETW